MNEFKKVFQIMDQCSSFLINEQENDWSELTHIQYVCQFYVSYFLLHVLVMRSLIPYHGRLPKIQTLKGKGSMPYLDADREVLQLLGGIMRGCRFELPICTILKYPVYRNGHSDFANLENRMNRDFHQHMKRLPQSVTAGWAEEIEEAIQECLEYGYYGNAGAVIIMWKNERYQKAAQNLKNREEIEKLNELHTLYEKSIDLLKNAIQLSEAKNETGKIYNGIIMPLLFPCAYNKIIRQRICDNINPMAIYSMLELQGTLDETERGM